MLIPSVRSAPPSIPTRSARSGQLRLPLGFSEAKTETRRPVAEDSYTPTTTRPDEDFLEKYFSAARRR
ncbi:MAG: hypothetical protein RLZZ344_1351 [Pseudomonadota bacterium]|jgi:hypothetical protein